MKAAQIQTLHPQPGKTNKRIVPTGASLLP